MVKNEEKLLKNAQTPKLRRGRKILFEVMNNAIKSADPRLAIRNKMKINENLLKIGPLNFDLSKIRNIVVVGGGKASGAMAEALDEVMGDRIGEGVVNVPKGTACMYRVRGIKLIEAGHPIPTEEGKKGAEKMMALVKNLGPQDLVICLISGGGSALISLPAEDTTLDELRETTNLLLKSGATIQEINAVRKHLSAIKGGQLAKAAYPAKVISLLISDVVGDKLDTIASGPTSPDPTTFSDALKVLEKYGLSEQVPFAVLNRLKKGAKSEIPETPKPGEECFRRTHNIIVASNANAIEAAADVGRSYGLNVHTLTTAMQGEAREVGKYLASVAKAVCETGKPIQKPSLLLSGGETTVTVTGEGIGGRNQELVLSASLHVSNLEDVTIASFSTDGIDGPTDAAGAVADSFTSKRARHRGLDPSCYLERNDSYHFFKELGDLLITGATGTNVMDIVALMIF